ncbi:MAG TPA: hypothetical protein VE172_12400 [Stackebrandtia sp.]|jgi:hypothetical protein|uniref:FitA-like ribbon-helix-helix domain-containing protein n=1 Tax=Stackebrandtia sp. TaxID=2023065 RepID=UPI002D2495A3|nr:hypothetical protein [Stackebrandtia sp.]HZE39602.1 hypothetical protein [Stackebrandtia sp.]
MVNIHIRDVSEKVRDNLAASARERGQSMQTYIKHLLEEDSQRHDNARLLENLAAMGGGYSRDTNH